MAQQPWTRDAIVDLLRLKAQARDNQPINPFLQLIRP